jgi:hypothetical protein
MVLDMVSQVNAMLRPLRLVRSGPSGTLLQPSTDRTASLPSAHIGCCILPVYSVPLIFVWQEKTTDFLEQEA